MVGGGGLVSSLCAPFAIVAVFSPWLHPCSAVHAGGQSCLGMVAGAVGGDSGSILVEDSMHA